MLYKTSLLIVLFWLLTIPAVLAQALNQEKLLMLLPSIPSNLSTATEAEVDAFRHRCDSINLLLSGIEEKYRRTADAESNSNLIMEYYDIRDSITDLHATQRNHYYDLFPLISDLEYETGAKNDLIMEQIERIKNNNSKSAEVKALEEQIYANRADCSEKQAALYLKFLSDYRTKLELIAEKADKSEVIPLPDHLNKNVSYVLLNVKNYMNYFSEVYRFNIGPPSAEY